MHGHEGSVEAVPGGLEAARALLLSPEVSSGMLDKLKKLVAVVLVLHLVAGACAILMLLLSAPLVVGVGRFAALTAEIETFDFKWLVVVAVALVWLWPVPPAIFYLWARGARQEMARVQAMLLKALDHSIPVEVDIDDRVPVHIDEPLRVPIEMSTKVDFDDAIDIETTIPLDTVIPLDSVIETSVLGIGSIKIPVRATIPLRMDLPVKSRMRVRAHGIPIALRESVAVAMPPFVIPLKFRLVTKIDLLDNLHRAEGLLRAKIS
jgi:hypothetical protein